jgi:CelD/BcsL family acetyltransferase involved in cellulose biosynthesis
MEQEMAEPGKATRSDGAAPAVQPGQKWMRERLAGDQDSIVRKAIEDGFYDPEVRISVSGRTERDAYDEARQKAAREFENPADW